MTKDKQTPMEIIEEAAKIADMYAKENFLLAGDTILHDPVLRGDGSVSAMAISEDQQTWGTIYSARAHAAQDIAKAIRDLKQAGYQIVKVKE